MKLVLEVDRGAVMCLAAAHVPLVSDVRVTCDEPASDVRVTIALSDAAPWVSEPLHLAPGLTRSLGEVRFAVPRLASLDRRERVVLSWRAEAGGVVLDAGQADVDLLATTEWPGTRAPPELLAAFVVPHDPAVGGLLASAAQHLGAELSECGYERRDPTRVLDAVRALCAALQELSLAPAWPPPEFETIGQPVRFPGELLSDRRATCLDLTLLVAACLERAGLSPLIVLARGHALPAVWLRGDRLVTAWLSEPLHLAKLAALGDIFAFDVAAVAERPAPPLAASEARARGWLAAPEDVLGALDVRVARQAGVLPIAFGAPPPPPEALSVERALEARQREETAIGRVAEPHPRVAAWLSRLLDLSLRNRLLSFNPRTRLCVPLEDHDVAALEDALATGRRLDLVAGPERSAIEARAAHLGAELAGGRLVTRVEAGPLERRLVDLWRAARNAVEEGGTNILYVALGMLHWFESESAEQARLAPILLWPVGLVRGSARTPWQLVKTDEDPILNVTLVELLRRDHGVELPSLNRLPLDDAGTDVEAILTAFRKAVLHLSRWRVTDEAHVGLFSFSKFLMWQDLRGSEVLRSPVVRSLVLQQPLEGGDAPFVRPEDVDEAIAPGDLPLALDADSSQVAAVAAAAGGRSFAVQGPPGTGKSQTIANVIAATLSQGKTVLFVSEKMAALSVVSSRLRRIGLGDFCLELHSNKTSKREVAVELARCLELPRTAHASAWDSRSAEVSTLRARLNDHVAALHEPRPHGASFFESAAELLALVDAPALELSIDAAAADRGSVERWEAAIAALVDATSGVGTPGGHPFRDVELTEWSATASLRIRRELDALDEATKQLSARADACAKALGVAVPGATVDVEELCGVAEDLSADEAAPERALDLAAWPELDERTRTYVERSRRHDSQKVALASRWTDDLYGLDLAALAGRFKRYAGAFFLVAWVMLFGARRRLKRVAVDGRLARSGAIAGDLGLAQHVLLEQPDLTAERASLAAEGVPAAWLDGEVAALHGGLDRATRLSRRLAHLLGPGAEVPAPIRALRAAAPSARAALAHIAADLRASLLRQRDAERALCGSLEVTPDSAWPERSEAGHREALLERLRAWSASFGRLRDWCTYQKAAREAERAGLGALALAHEAGHVETRALPAAFRRAFLTHWCAATEDADPRLSGFSGADHHRAVRTFADRDAAHIDEARREVRARLSARLPDAGGPAAASSEIGKLLREARKKRSVMPIRALLHELPTLLPRLKPCLLMSPLSVAQYLPPDGRRFDLVVFDEASQICTHDAIGALARGDHAMVVGDSRQLPPTSFFQRSEDDDEPDDEEVVELESILDEVVASGLPQQHLRWHYRSRHEALIAFSNRAFYDGRLLTFPSPHAGAGSLGVGWHHVDGVYDRGRSCTNAVEAEALVAHLVARLLEPEQRSYGVVTFSIKQQALVEDLLDRARATRPELEPHFAGDEPVFVKNLENVQGDERDVILLSIAYGPDRAGRIAMGFGPLSLDGGERRLNVAVTRARQRLEVFSSLRDADIDLARTTRQGPRHLKAFLRYAERGPEAAGIGSGLGRPTGYAPQVPAAAQRPEPGAADRATATQPPKPEARSPRPGAASQATEAQPPEPGGEADVQPAARSPEPGARSPEPGGEADVQPAARSPEPGARSPEQEVRAGSSRAETQIRGASAGRPYLSLRLRASARDQPGARSPEPGARSPEPEAAVHVATPPHPAVAGSAEREPGHTAFEDSVRRALDAAGHTVHARVGCGDYRVDLAVVDPERPGAYLLGIECDGAMYAAAPSARDRDRLRREVLEGLGWCLHRVWLSDWRYQQDREMERLDARLEALLAGRPAPEEPAPPPSDAPEPADPADPIADVLVPYRFATLDPRGAEEFFLADSSAALAEIVTSVVAIEGPVHVEEVLRRLAEAFAILRVTGRVRARLDEIVDVLARDGVVAPLDGFLWPAGVDPSSWDGLRGPAVDGTTRRAEHVPLEEVANAAWRVLRRNLALSEDDLARGAASVLGLARLAGRAEERVQAGIALLVARRPCRRDGDRIRLEE